MAQVMARVVGAAEPCRGGVRRVRPARLLCAERGGWSHRSTAPHTAAHARPGARKHERARPGSGTRAPPGAAPRPRPPRSAPRPGDRQRGGTRCAGIPRPAILYEPIFLFGFFGFAHMERFSPPPTHPPRDPTPRPRLPHWRLAWRCGTPTPSSLPDPRPPSASRLPPAHRTSACTPDERRPSRIRPIAISPSPPRVLPRALPRVLPRVLARPL